MSALVEAYLTGCRVSGARSSDAICQALERARVVAVLDGWEESGDYPRQVKIELRDITYYLWLVESGCNARTFTGVSRDAARAAAAAAIEKGDV